MITFNHFNFNVLNLDKSLAFYKEALGLVPVREKEASDGSFKLVYLGEDVYKRQPLRRSHLLYGVRPWGRAPLGEEMASAGIYIRPWHFLQLFHQRL